MSTSGAEQISDSIWNIDPAHSIVEFKVRHMAISNVKGQFTKFAGALKLDDRDPTDSSIEATIEANSIETRDVGRDEHLKSADFLNAEKFPLLTFKSVGIRVVRPGELAVEGDLTIRGVTRHILLNVEGPTPPQKDPWGNFRIAVSAVTKISRREFGLVWNAALESGGILVGDDVTISLDVQFVRAAT